MQVTESNSSQTRIACFCNNLFWVQYSFTINTVHSTKLRLHTQHIRADKGILKPFDSSTSSIFSNITSVHNPNKPLPIASAELLKGALQTHMGQNIMREPLLAGKTACFYIRNNCFLKGNTNIIFWNRTFLGYFLINSNIAHG